MLEPTTTILVALGIGAATKANEQVKDTYQTLKGLIQSRFAGQPSVEKALAEYEKTPTVGRTPLRRALAQEHIDEDEPVVKTARQLLAQAERAEQAEQEERGSGIYNVRIKATVQGYNEGKYQQVIMNVGSEASDT